MKNTIKLLFILSLFVISCKSDDTVECRSCSAAITTPFELCREANGNASVNGQDTGVEYAVYLEGLVSEGVSCN